jgi:hypothetical protein
MWEIPLKIPICPTLLALLRIQDALSPQRYAKTIESVVKRGPQFNRTRICMVQQ